VKAVATITSKGQITVPSAVRRELGLRDGDGLEFTVTRGQAVVRPIKPRRSSAGILHYLLPATWRAPTVEALDDGIGKHLARKHRRRP
jgi:AbrB family looped-hinge helix DNA binding protein